MVVVVVWGEARGGRRVVRLVMIVTRCNSYYQGTLLAFLGQGITKLLIGSLFTSRIGLNIHIYNI